MKVLRDRPSPSLGYGIAAPMSVSRADGKRMRVDSWSLRGFVVAAWNDLEPGKRQHIAVHLDLQGYEIGAAVEIEAVGDGEFDFVDLPERTRNLMEQVASDLVHGRITSTEDALLRIDTPEDPISVAPDKPKTEERKRVSLRPFIMSAFYILMGLVVFGYVGVLIHANFVKLEVQTAVLSRPVEVLAIPVDGRISVYPVAIGSRVAQGELLAVVSDPELETKIDSQRVALRLAEAAVKSLLSTIEVERARFADYQVINETDVRIVDAEVTGLKDELERTEQHLERIETLLAKGFATQAQLEDARAANALVESRLTSARLMAARKGTLNDAAARRHHNGREFVVDLDLLAIELETARAKRDAAAAELAIMLERKGALALASPFDGQVVDMMHAANTPLIRGTHVLTIEQTSAPVVEAYLNQEEVVQIGLGDAATVFLPSVDTRLPARVVEIDRTSGFVDEQEAQYVWRGPQDRSARVLLTLDADAHGLPSGLPAIVLFERRGTDTVRHDLADTLTPDGDDV